MPTYPYDCTTCKGVWETVATINAPTDTICPHCGGQTARRLIAGSYFKLMGVGWAKDGYSPGQSPKRED